MSARDRYVYGLRGEYGGLIYIGVGKGNRMFEHMRRARRGEIGNGSRAKGQYLIDCVTNCIAVDPYKIAENLTIDEACALEIEIIELLGRRDLGTGDLLNANAGGFGCKNLSPNTRAKIGTANSERKRSAEEIVKLSNAAQKRARSPEGRTHLSAAARKQWVTRPHTISPEIREKMSEGARKRSPESRAKAAAARTGKGHSLETRARLAEINRGKVHSLETRAKMSASATGKTRSPEHCANLAKAIRGSKHPPERCAKNAEARRGKKHSPETRAKMSAAQRGKTLSPAHCAKIAEKKRLWWAARNSVELTHAV